MYALRATLKRMVGDPSILTAIPIVFRAAVCPTFCNFPKGPDMHFCFQQHDNINANSLIKKNVKRKKLLCFFPWPSLSPLTFLMSGFISQAHQMPNTIWSFKKSWDTV